jgi:hypothetical protein
MNIDPHPDPSKPHKAIVSFDNVDEREWFGAGAPFLSQEHFRHMLYTFWLVEEGEFPQHVEVSHRIIGHVAGRMAEGPVPNPEVNVARRSILEATSKYLGSTALELYPEEIPPEKGSSKKETKPPSSLWSSWQRQIS